MDIKIETERLYLRRFLPSDAEDMFEMDSNPKVHRFLGNNPVKKIEDTIEKIKEVSQQYEDYGVGRLAMILKSTNEYVGWSGLKFEKELRKEFDYYDLGYRLKEKYWGHGFATEAAIGSLEYGFNELRLNEINACADVNHAVSNKILKKIGFIPDGTFTFEGALINWYYLKNKS